jgi:hypothetical protein
MMSFQPPTAAKPASTAIPVQLSPQEFAAFILPHLSLSKRGPQCKLGSHKPFNSILKVLSPSACSGRSCRGRKGRRARPSGTTGGVFKLVARWAEEGALEEAFLASLTQRAAAQK